MYQGRFFAFFLTSLISALISSRVISERPVSFAIWWQRANAFLAKSLQLFKEIILNTSYYNKESDFKIEAEILSAKEIKTVTAYGVSFLYIYLHGSGLPSGNLENELKLKVKLFETKSKRILFEKTYEDKANRRQTQFNHDRIQLQNEIEIVQRMFPEIANDIVNAIMKK